MKNFILNFMVLAFIAPSFAKTNVDNVKKRSFEKILDIYVQKFPSEVKKITKTYFFKEHFSESFGKNLVKDVTSGKIKVNKIDKSSFKLTVNGKENLISFDSVSETFRVNDKVKFGVEELRNPQKLALKFQENKIVSFSLISNAYAGIPVIAYVIIAAVLILFNLAANALLSKGDKMICENASKEIDELIGNNLVVCENELPQVLSGNLTLKQTETFKFIQESEAPLTLAGKLVATKLDYKVANFSGSDALNQCAQFVEKRLSSMTNFFVGTKDTCFNDSYLKKFCKKLISFSECSEKMKNAKPGAIRDGELQKDSNDDVKDCKDCTGAKVIKKF